MSVAEDLLTLVQQLPGYTDALGQYVQALGAMFAEVESYAADMDSQPGWTNLWMPSVEFPNALGFQATLVGETLAAGITALAAVAQIEAAPHQMRGSPNSIVSAVKACLTGSQTIGYAERQQPDGSEDDDALTIFTYAAETPSAAAVENALVATVPADIRWYYAALEQATWEAVEEGMSDWTELEATYGPTWANVAGATPGFIID